MVDGNLQNFAVEFERKTTQRVSFDEGEISILSKRSVVFVKLTWWEINCKLHKIKMFYI